MEKIADGFDLLEGPVWDPARGLLVADAGKGGVYSIADDGRVTTIIEHRRGIGGMVAHADGGLIVSGRNVAYKDDAGGPTRVLFDNDPDKGRIGFNDITTDAAGRVYAGSLGFYPTKAGDTPRPGALYMVDLDGAVHKLFDGVRLTNGMAFSADGARLYHADSGDQTVHAYDVTPDGRVGSRRPFVSVETGLPDGLALAADGSLWLAVAHAGQVLVFEGDGRLRRRIEFPVPMVTSLCFGGPDLRTLYVVTGSEGLEGDVGCVFRLTAEVPGVPVAPARVRLPTAP